MHNLGMCLIKDCGQPRYRIMQWIKQGKIRYVKAGNRYLLNKEWLEEDIQKMAEENLKQQMPNPVYGTLRAVKCK